MIPDSSIFGAFILPSILDSKLDFKICLEL